MNKGISSISLPLAIILPFLSTLLFLQVQKIVIKKEVKEQVIKELSRDDLIQFVFNLETFQSKLKWKDDKEFRFEGQMYDVVDRENKGDTVYIWCWWDHEESQIEKQIEAILSLIAPHDQEDPVNMNRLEDFIKSVYLPPAPEYTNNGSLHKLVILHPFDVILHSLPPPTPPPRPV